MKQLIFKQILIWSGLGSSQWLLFVIIDSLLRNRLYTRYGIISNEGSGRVIAEVHIMSPFNMQMIYLWLLFLFILVSVFIVIVLKKRSSVFFRWQAVGLPLIILWTVTEQLIGIFTGYDFTYLLPGLLSALVYLVIIQLVGVAIKYTNKSNSPIASNLR